MMKRAQRIVDDAASLPALPSSSSAGKRRKRKKRTLPRCPPHRRGWRRPRVLQREVPAVQGVRVDSASDSVHRRLLDIPVVQQRQVRGSMVQKTVVVPQLQFIACRRLAFRAADSDPHGLACSEDHRDSPVAVRCQVVDVPFVDVNVQKTGESAVAAHQQGLQHPCRGAEAGSHVLDCSHAGCAGFQVINFPVVVQRPFPMDLVTIETPQLLVDKVVDAPILQGVQVVDIPVVTRRLIHMSSLTLEIPQFVFDKVIDAPVVQVVLAMPVVDNNRCAKFRPAEVPQVQFLQWLWTSLLHAATCSRQSGRSLRLVH